MDKLKRGYVVEPGQCWILSGQYLLKKKIKSLIELLIDVIYVAFKHV